MEDPHILGLMAILSGPVIAAGTVGALFWGVWTYKRSAEAQAQLLALRTLQHYLDLALAHPDLASREDGQPVDARYAWFAAHSLATAQTLWLLVGRRTDWQRSIDAIVRHHRAFLSSGAFVCKDYNPAFVDYLRARAPELVCADMVALPRSSDALACNGGKGRGHA